MNKPGLSITRQANHDRPDRLLGMWRRRHDLRWVVFGHFWGGEGTDRFWTPRLGERPLFGFRIISGPTSIVDISDNDGNS